MAAKVWNAHIDEFGYEPTDARKFHKYSEVHKEFKILSFQQARNFYNDNKGKGKIDENIIITDNKSPKLPKSTVKPNTNPFANAEKVRLVCIGDTAIGKTCLLMSYISNSSQSALVPTIFESVIINKIININNIDIPFNIQTFDTASKEEFNSLRIKAYHNVNICLLCFDISDIKTLQNIDNKWYTEIKQYAPSSVIIVLVGLKSDLKNVNNGDNAISIDVINEYKTKINAIDYIETSALKKINIQKVFEIPIKTFIESDEYKNRKASSLDRALSPDIRPASSSIGTLIKNHQKQWQEHLKNVDNQSSRNMNAAWQQPQQQQQQQYNGQYNMNMVQQQQYMAAMYQQQQYYQNYYRQQQQLQNNQLVARQQQQHNINQNISHTNQQDDIPPPPPPPPPPPVDDNVNRIGMETDNNTEKITWDTFNDDHSKIDDGGNDDYEQPLLENQRLSTFDKKLMKQKKKCCVIL